MTKAHQYVQKHHSIFKDRFIDLLKIKSISTDLAFSEDVLKAANWIKTRMEHIGLTAELVHMPEGQHPVIFGTWDKAGADAETVLIYCHYDVQPAVIADGWDSDPFIPVEKDGKIIARGATDSKVHVMAWLSALEALLTTDECPVNIKLVFEGEEEALGLTIRHFVQQFPEKVRADRVVISDGIIRNPQQPSLIYGLRGVVTFELHVYGPQRDLHSGHFGGTVHNPAQAITEIIAQLHDENGFITVEGFYDDVTELSAEERAFLAESDASITQEWDEVANAPKHWGERDFTLHERIGARPTLEINGIAGGYTGDGFKTVLPAHAMAKISCRLVPDQDPKSILKVVQDHIRKIAPDTVTVEFTNSEFGAPAILIDYNSDAMQAAYRAYQKGWGVPPVFERAGGSVPITHDLLAISDDIAIMGFSYKGGGAHGPNENIPLQMFYNGIDTAIYFLQDLANKDEA